MGLTGRPRVEVDVNVLTPSKATQLVGVAAVIGETERGEIGKTYLIRNWQEFEKYLGGFPENWKDYFATDFPVLCYRALNQGSPLLVTRAEHYTDPTDNTTGASTKGTVTLAGVAFTARSVGDFTSLIKVSTAANGVATQFDILVQISGMKDFEYRNMPSVVTQTLADKFNSLSPEVKIAAGTIVLPASPTPVSGALAGGNYEASAIVDADYVGDSEAGTGIHALLNETNFVRISVPHKASNAIDVALQAVCNTEMPTYRAILRTPTGISGNVAKDYRKCEGSYSTGTKLNNHLCSMYYGELQTIVHPVTKQNVNISAIGDILGLKAKRDNNLGQWFSSSGSKFPITDATGVYYNLAANSKKSEWDDLSDAGVNAVVNDPDFGVVPFDNRTLQMTEDLLSNENVSELIVHMTRTIIALAKPSQFEPNDVQEWNAIWRRVNPFLQSLVTGRAIRPNYLYEGDQNVDKIEDAVYNDLTDVDNGEYSFRITFAPIVALKYISITFNVVSTEVSATLEVL